MASTYRVVRFHEDHARQVLMTGLSLEEAQAHCQNPETSSRTATGPEAREYTRKYGAWFDGYEEE